MYGSDALAGVVNFVMRKDFEGIEVDGQFGIAQADNTNASYRSIVSAAGDPLARGRSLGRVKTRPAPSAHEAQRREHQRRRTSAAYLGYQNTSAVLAGARDFSACSLGTNGPSTAHVCGGSSTLNKFISLDTKQTFFEEGTGAPGSGHYVPFVGGTR